MNGLLRLGLRAATEWVYPGGAGCKLPILMYHRVLARPDPLLPELPDARLVDRQMRAIAETFNVLPLDEAIERLAQGRLPPRPMAITFDDGYRDNHDVALPILRRHGLCASFFVSTGFLDGGRMFNDTVIEWVRQLPAGPIELPQWGVTGLAVHDDASRIEAIERLVSAVKYRSQHERDAFCAELQQRARVPLPDTLMMTAEQLRGLVEQGMSVGGHTVTHPILQRLADDEARDEIVRNRDELEAITGVRPTCFAFPNGKPLADFGAAHVAMVREAGYQAALSTAYAVPDANADRFQLPRFVPIERHAAALVARTVRMAFHPGPTLV